MANIRGEVKKVLAQTSSQNNEMSKQFKCPKCGSNRFGTSFAGDWDKAIGRCHSYNGCSYSWPRKHDDKRGVFIHINHKEE